MRSSVMIFNPICDVLSVSPTPCLRSSVIHFGHFTISRLAITSSTTCARVGSDASIDIEGHKLAILAFFLEKLIQVTSFTFRYPFVLTFVFIIWMDR